MASFDRLAELRKLYDIAWSSIAEAPADKRAPLIARAESLAQQIESVSGQTEKTGDPVDEIAARRAARGGATARSRRPAAK